MFKKIIPPCLGIVAALSAGSLAWAQDAPPEPTAEPAESTEAATETSTESAPPADSIAVEPVREVTPADPTAKADKAKDERVQLEDIQVTASKRAQSLRDVAGSVDALRGSELEDMKAQGMADYLKRVPGVVLVDRGADGGQPVIRGIAASVGALGTQFTQLPVGIFVDDMPFTDLYVPFSQPDLNPFDLERVEVLKGPQGTLFGSGALAGAVRYILQKPKTSVWETKLTASFTNDPYSDGLSPVYGAALNVPLYGDEAALRVVGLTRRKTGLIDEIDGAQDVDRLQQGTARALATWTVNESLKLDAFYFQQDTDQQNSSNADNPERFDREASGTALRESGLSGTNLNVSYLTEWGELLSSSNYLTKRIVNDATEPTGVADPNGDPDGDGGENGPGTEDAGQEGLRGVLNSDVKGFFQEFRLSSPDGADWQWTDDISARWLVGAAYQKSNQFVLQSSTASAVDETFGPIDGLPIFPIETPQGPISGSRNAAVLYAELDGVARESAVYGEITAAIAEKWEATLGARAFKTTLRVTGFLEGAQVTALDAGTTRYNLDRDFKDDGINPKFSLRYEINDQWQVYTLAAKGFQFGGIQLNPPFASLEAAVPDAFAQYLSSELWNYEAGIRSEFFDRRLKIDLAAFYLDWEDLQITVRRALVPGGEDLGLTIGFTENIGAARSRGVELALSADLMPGLNFTNGSAWISARTTEDFDSTSGFVEAGTRLPASPRFQMSNVLSYSAPFQLLGAWEGSVSLSHTHLGSSFNDLQYSREQGGYDTIDLRFGLLKVNERFVPDLSLSLLNLTDVRGVAAVSAGGGLRDAGYFFIQPRTTLLSITAKF